MPIIEPSQPDTWEDSNYRRMWLHVILRAVEEAKGVNLITDRQNDAPSIQHEARLWLSMDTPDLRWVCHAAGTTGDKLLKRYGRKYGNRGD